MTRARRRKARIQTEDAEWQRRREYILRWWPGDSLAECLRFWQREPGIPDALHSKKTRYRVLTVTGNAAVEAERRAECDDLKARPMAWLRERG